MKAKITFYTLLCMLLSMEIAYPQDDLTKEDSLRIEEMLRKSPQEVHRQKVRARQEERIEYLDSLITEDSTNYDAINQKISQLILNRELDEANKVLHQFHNRTLHTSKYDFVKATLFDFQREYEMADSLYRQISNQLSSEFELSASGHEKAEAILGMWYINKYLGHESKADSLLNVLREKYYQSINIGVDWNYFYRRFGGGVFNQ